MNKTLADLLKISVITGKNPALVQAGGGNTSVKTPNEKFMYIKASGFALKDMSYKTGWRRVRLSEISEIIKNARQIKESTLANRLLLACDDNLKSEVPPSVETLLHCLLARCVIHLHPVVVCAYVNAQNGRSQINRLFRDEKYPPLWVSYANPGFSLAAKTSKLIESYESRFGIKPSVMFLARHGLFISENNADDALRRLKNVISRCEKNLPKYAPLNISRPARKNILLAKNAVIKAYTEVTASRKNVRFFFNKDIARFLSRKDASLLLAGGALTAAELVYAGGPPIWCQFPSRKIITDKLKTCIERYHSLPAAFLIKRLGLFVVADKTNVHSIADVVIASLGIRRLASHFGGVLPLPSRGQKFIKRAYIRQKTT